MLDALDVTTRRRDWMQQLTGCNKRNFPLPRLTRPISRASYSNSRLVPACTALRLVQHVSLPPFLPSLSRGISLIKQGLRPELAVNCIPGTHRYCQSNRGGGGRGVEPHPKKIIKKIIIKTDIKIYGGGRHLEQLPHGHEVQPVRAAAPIPAPAPRHFHVTMESQLSYDGRSLRHTLT